MKDSRSHKLIQDSDKSFPALAVPKCLALTILVNSHNYQGHVTKTENILSSKEASFGKECKIKT